MGFRTLEISQAAELHIVQGQLDITSSDGKLKIPIEDIDQIYVHGPNIRLSTMDLSILCQNKIGIMTLDEKYLPTAIVLAFEGHSRQAKLMHAQINVDGTKMKKIWFDLIKQKITNQSQVLSILKLEGEEKVIAYMNLMTIDNIDSCEALAAKAYFQFYHKGLNRRSDDPINSRLNYGYAIIRGYIARTLTSIGFHPTFGIHHNNQLNAFNLVDDLIELYRAFVDLAAYEICDSNGILTKEDRNKMAHVLYVACMVEGVKMNIMTAIEMTCKCFKHIILDNSDETIKLPQLLPVESMESITE